MYLYHQLASKRKKSKIKYHQLASKLPFDRQIEDLLRVSIITIYYVRE
jgi:hypothetical protein